MDRQHDYPDPSLTDDGLLQEIFATLNQCESAVINPYANDGAYATAISVLPVGLRAMAATHHLDISLTLDDLGWHFLNFGEPGFVAETEAGLRELGLIDMAEWFAEAHAIVDPLRAEIDRCGDYYLCLESHGKWPRIDELTESARMSKPTLSDSPIYAAWVRYARRYPEKVFGKPAIEK